MDKPDNKCENCDCALTKDNCTYEDGICDDCYEADGWDFGDEEDE